MRTLRQIRTEKNLTQQELSKKANVSIQVLAKLEWGKGTGGKTTVQICNCKKVADALDITLDELWDSITTDSEPPKQGNSILRWSKENK